MKSAKREHTSRILTLLKIWHTMKKGMSTFGLDGRKLKFQRESRKITENGYSVISKYYANEKCDGCPHRDKCHHSKNGYRTIKVNQILREYRPKVLEALTTEEGTLLRMNRSIQIEGVFGVLKEDYGFRRFLTRDKKNIETHFFLIAFAFDIEKLCNRTRKGRNGLYLLSLSGGLFLFFRRKRGREYKKDLIHPKMNKVFSFFIPFSLLFYP